MGGGDPWKLKGGKGCRSTYKALIRWFSVHYVYISLNFMVLELSLNCHVARRWCFISKVLAQGKAAAVKVFWVLKCTLEPKVVSCALECVRRFNRRPNAALKGCRLWIETLPLSHSHGTSNSGVSFTNRLILFRYAVEQPVRILKDCGPSAISVELTNLAPEGGGSTDLLLAFIRMIDSMLASGRDFDLAHSYLALFLKVGPPMRIYLRGEIGPIHDCWPLTFVFRSAPPSPAVWGTWGHGCFGQLVVPPGGRVGWAAGLDRPVTLPFSVRQECAAVTACMCFVVFSFCIL